MKRCQHAEYLAAKPYKNDEKNRVKKSIDRGKRVAAGNEYWNGTKSSVQLYM